MTSRFDRSFASAQRAYDSMEAPGSDCCDDCGGSGMLSCESCNATGMHGSGNGSCFECDGQGGMPCSCKASPVAYARAMEKIHADYDLDADDINF